MSRKNRKTKADDIIDKINGEFREATVEIMEATENVIPQDISSEDYIKARGIPEAKIEFTMNKYNMTREQVIEKLRGY
jgi:hypothetical protein